jgi:hypothetical protein
MTPEMRFECVLVSKDPAVLGAWLERRYRIKQPLIAV